MNGLLKNFSSSIKPIIADRRFDVQNIIIEALASSRIYPDVKTKHHANKRFANLFHFNLKIKIIKKKFSISVRMIDMYERL